MRILDLIKKNDSHATVTRKSRDSHATVTLPIWNLIKKVRHAVRHVVRHAVRHALQESTLPNYDD